MFCQYMMVQRMTDYESTNTRNKKEVLIELRRTINMKHNFGDGFQVLV